MKNEKQKIVKKCATCKSYVPLYADGGNCNKGKKLTNEKAVLMVHSTNVCEDEDGWEIIE